MAKLIKKKMGLKTCALDPSLTGSALVMFEDGKFVDYYFFTCVKKYKDDKHAIVLPKEFNDDIDRLIHIKREIITRILKFNPDYFAVEGYADRAQGRNFTIGGFVEGIKEAVYLEYIPIRIYEPMRLKLFITGHGNSGKADMAVACYKKYGIDFTQYRKDISENIVDAYCLGEMLNFELNVREGKINLDDQKKYIKDTFTKKTDSNPIPLIEREFIKRKGV